LIYFCSLIEIFVISMWCTGKKSNLYYNRTYPYGCHEWAVSNSATLRQGSHNRVATVPT